MSAARPIVAAALTIGIFALILRRVPFPALTAALQDADYRTFLALMIPNTLFYFAWDTLVLDRRDPLVSRRGAVSRSPAGPRRLVRGRLLQHQSRTRRAGRLPVADALRAPFLELGSTVIFLVLTEYTQLVLWSMLGLIGFRAEVSRGLLGVAAAVAIFLDPRPRRFSRRASWSIVRTFRLATFDQLRADRRAACADVLRLAVPALLRGAGVRDPDPVQCRC